VGRLEKVKGFDLLISSWRNIKTNLVIIGSGQEKDSLIKLIEQYNLTKKIKIIDEVKSDKLNDYYSKASVLIISSIDEGGPRVALEALYLKIPVLSTNVGHMNQIFPNDVLAEKNNLLNQDAIFEYVKEEFSLEEKTLQTVSVYEDLLKS
jgi:glycosyltransferase involved in cell wall biosynthesis